MQSTLVTINRLEVPWLSDNVVVYKVLEQKMDKVEGNLSKMVEENVNQIKKSVFESNLFKTLNKQYPAQKYVKGI